MDPLRDLLDALLSAVERGIPEEAWKAEAKDKWKHHEQPILARAIRHTNACVEDLRAIQKVVLLQSFNLERWESIFYHSQALMKLSELTIREIQETTNKFAKAA